MEKWGTTFSRDMRKVLRCYGWKMSRMYRIGHAPLPPLAIVFIKYGVDEDVKGHVAVWHRGTIYDPAYGVQPDYPNKKFKLSFYSAVTRI
jgi:hypothetical protein